MSFDFTAEPVVRSPKDRRPKKGRGFSIAEVKEAGISIRQARDMGLIVDLRRKTCHQENIEVLKQYAADLQKAIVEPKKVPPKKPSKDVEQAIAELSSLRAVKKTEAEALVKAGIKSFSDLAFCEIDKVANKTGIDEDRITQMVKAALKKI
jgi:large subunit ribosomal protein L13e